MSIFLGKIYRRDFKIRDVNCSELPTVTFWPYFDTVTLKMYGNTVCEKKNTAANLPKITAVKSSVDFVNPLKFVIAAAVLPVSANRP